jgi:hypothetical protein
MYLFLFKSVASSDAFDCRGFEGPCIIGLNENRLRSPFPAYLDLFVALRLHFSNRIYNVACVL